MCRTRVAATSTRRGSRREECRCQRRYHLRAQTVPCQRCAFCALRGRDSPSSIGRRLAAEVAGERGTLRSARLYGEEWSIWSGKEMASER